MQLNKRKTLTKVNSVPDFNSYFTKNNTLFFNNGTQLNLSDEEQINVLKECKEKLATLKNKLQEIDETVNNSHTLKVKYDSYLKYLSDADIKVNFGNKFDESLSPQIHIYTKNENGKYDIIIRNHTGEEMRYNWPITSNIELLKNISNAVREQKQLCATQVLEECKKDPEFCKFMDIHQPAPNENFKDIVRQYDECSKNYEDIKLCMQSVGITEDEIDRIETAARKNTPYLPSTQGDINYIKRQTNDEIKSQVTDPYNERAKSYKNAYIASGILSFVGIGVLGLAITGLIHLIDKVSTKIKAKKKEKNFKIEEEKLVTEFNESIDENKSDMDIKSYKEIVKYSFLNTMKKYPKDDVDAIAHELNIGSLTN